MSYFADVDAAERADVVELVAHALEGAGAGLPPDQRDAFSDHMAAALDAVDALVFAPVGTEGDRVAVTISGHVTPDHGPLEGWADEHVTVTVRVVR